VLIRPLVLPINFFFLSQFTALSSRAVDGYQMYFEGSVVSKASTSGIGILPTLPVIFTEGVKKCEIWRHLKLHSSLSRPRLKMQQDI